MLIWTIQVCVNTVPGKKSVNNELREATVGAYQSGKDYKAISKQFEVNPSTVREIIRKWKTLKTDANLPSKISSKGHRRGGVCVGVCV